MNNFTEKRFWEIDFLRAIAILMMIIFHALYDFNYFNIYKFNVNEGFLFYFARATASIFIFLVGISLILSFSKAKNNGYLKYFKKGFKVFFWGLMISLITYLFLEKGFVIFGILHFIGISIILSYPFLRLKKLNLLIGIILILTGIYLNKFLFNFNWLLWAGLKPQNFYTIDYFPLLPWFGVMLIGISFGNTFYRGYKRMFKLPNLTKFSIIRKLCFVGQNSLIVYLIHQPILIILLYTFKFFHNLVTNYNTILLT